MNKFIVLAVLFGLLFATCASSVDTVHDESARATINAGMSDPREVDDFVLRKIYHDLTTSLDLLEQYAVMNHGVVLSDTHPRLVEKRRNKFEFIRFGRK
uniref:RxLR effector protein n=1 Tax=Parastrongyloides trichosuri TaxID=131310 RepID=A0A0N4ZCM5_PARTI